MAFTKGIKDSTVRDILNAASVASAFILQLFHCTKVFIVA